MNSFRTVNINMIRFIFIIGFIIVSIMNVSASGSAEEHRNHRHETIVTDVHSGKFTVSCTPMKKMSQVEIVENSNGATRTGTTLLSCNIFSMYIQYINDYHAVIADIAELEENIKNDWQLFVQDNMVFETN